MLALSINNNTYQRQVRASACKHSSLLANLLEDIPDDSEPIPLNNITDPATLDDIINFLHTYEDKTQNLSAAELLALTDEKYSKLYLLPWIKPFRYLGADLTKIDTPNFRTDVNQTRLSQLILAAYYLDIAPLYQTLSRQYAEVIRGKSPAELRELFGVPVEAKEAKGT